MEEHKIMFGTLQQDGTVTNIKMIPQRIFANCPFYIMALENYNPDGTCKCSDPIHRITTMKRWGYRKQQFVDAGVIKKNQKIGDRS